MNDEVGIKGGVHEGKSEVDNPIPECFRPEQRLAKRSMDGRVVYEDVTMSGLSGQDMKNVGEKIAKIFPSFTVWVTGGPYRGYDVRHQIDTKNKIISIDFYSPRPGIQHIPQIIREIKLLLQKKGISP